MKNKHTEAPGKKDNESIDSNSVSNIVLARESSQNNYSKDCESRDDIENNCNNAWYLNFFR